jgi:hypothetical protein
LGPKQPAQRKHLHREIVLFDDTPRPDKIVQLAATDDAITPLDQSKEQVERAASHSRFLPADEQLALLWPHLDIVEADGKRAARRICNSTGVMPKAWFVAPVHCRPRLRPTATAFHKFKAAPNANKGLPHDECG